jgi:hypothetical protein
LFDVAITRNQGGKEPTDHLQSLIATAQRNGWISREVAEYSDVLREHRNLVHPKKQFTGGYAPEDKVVQIAWQVVVAALNDLSRLPPAP